MSHAEPTGRGRPRWSAGVVASHSTAVPAGMASTPAEPLAGSRVKVGPPLSARGPSTGVVPGRSPGPVSPHVPSSAMLYPPDAVTPLQLGPLSEKTEPLIESVPAMRSTAAENKEVLSVNVEELIV